MALYDPTLWSAKRYQGVPFWSLFQGDLGLLDAPNIREAKRADVVAALADARQMLAHGFELGVPTHDTARALCDLVTNFSALIANRAMARALEQLLTALAWFGPAREGRAIEALRVPTSTG